jgi:hypothetical protein
VIPSRYPCDWLQGYNTPSRLSCCVVSLSPLRHAALSRTFSIGWHSTHSRSKSRPGTLLSQIEKNATHLLVALKQLLETLNKWSRHQATEAQVSDIYVRLGFMFNVYAETLPRLKLTLLSSKRSQSFFDLSWRQLSVKRLVERAWTDISRAFEKLSSHSFRV